jgi:hypothetical protein
MPRGPSSGQPSGVQVPLSVKKMKSQAMKKLMFKMVWANGVKVLQVCMEQLLVKNFA